ncbi:hypothetical protein CGLO_06917 [Colletotrichum gloeosporioides Cg-14]|uniref:Uncharacterized protein n=1 Tax=Colletotrichum gloeosporioides (strain Cg-14) TaxID=1237896 RepID=T0KMV8_COLGC|nr:hypothetical protein CGLO_06917 [Colletotrichum gloeosporioides Cg-14]
MTAIVLLWYGMRLLQEPGERDLKTRFGSQGAVVAVVVVVESSNDVVKDRRR